jgi:hypothetical protein
MFRYRQKPIHIILYDVKGQNFPTKDISFLKRFIFQTFLRFFAQATARLPCGIYIFMK